MSVEFLDGGIILGFIEDDEAFNGSVQDRFACLDTNHDGLLSYSEMLQELQSLRMIETHFGIDEKTDPKELSRVYDSLFVQYDRDSNGTVDMEEFKAETKRMMLDIANDLGFLPVQMILDEDSFLKKAVEREFTKLQSDISAYFIPINKISQLALSMEMGRRKAESAIPVSVSESLTLSPSSTDAGNQIHSL
ncbi:hypothetical protein LXL04_038058 [Taraxacum kok-saghyz]